MTKLAEIQHAIAELPADDRIRLWHWFRTHEAEAKDGPEPEFDAVWKAETQRRVAEIESGHEPGIPGEQVMAEARRIVGL